MHIQSKIALALLSLAMVLPVAHAQAQDQDDPAGAGPGIEQQGRPDGPSGRWQGRGGDGWRSGRGKGGWGDGERMGMRGRRRQGREFMLARLVNDPAIRERLGITPEQAAKIRLQTFDFRKSQIRGRADLEIKRLELRELLAADNPDRAALDQKLQEISAARLTQEKAAIDFRLAMRNALTPEQRQKLQQMRDEFRRRGPGGDRGGPQGMRPRRPPQGAPPASKPSGEN